MQFTAVVLGRSICLAHFRLTGPCCFYSARLLYGMKIKTKSPHMFENLSLLHWINAWILSQMWLQTCFQVGYAWLGDTRLGLTCRPRCSCWSHCVSDWHSIHWSYRYSSTLFVLSVSLSGFSLMKFMTFSLWQDFDPFFFFFNVLVFTFWRKISVF